MSRYDGDQDAPLSAMPVEFYEEFSAGIHCAMGWDKPEPVSPVIALDDQPCNLCGGAGELRDDSGYGFETITTCACAGTGSRAHIITERNDQ